MPTTSERMRVVITRETIQDEDGTTNFYNWKVQIRTPKLDPARGCMIDQFVWKDHIVLHGEGLYDNADDLEQTIQGWNLLDGNLAILPIVREWQP